MRSAVAHAFRLTALAFAIALSSQAAQADVFDISAAARGWVCTGNSFICFGGNNGANPGGNYFAGSVADDRGPAQTRNWFQFAIPDLSGATLVSATLRLNDVGHSGGNLT